MWFEVPPTAPVNEHEIIKDGVRLIPVTSKWFTNIEHGRRHEPLELMNMADNLKFNKGIKKKS